MSTQIQSVDPWLLNYLKFNCSNITLVFSDLTSTYTIVPVIPILTGFNGYKQLDDTVVPVFLILSKCLVYGYYGERVVWEWDGKQPLIFLKYVFCHLYEWLNPEDEDQESEDSPPKIYKHYQSNYLDSFLFLFVFSAFYHAGHSFIASWIPIIQPFWWMVNGHIGMVYFVLAKIGWVDFGPIINLMVPAFTGIGYGAGLAHLVIPPDPAICLTTILAYLQMRKGKCNTREDCCLTVVCTSLVAHILTGSWRGWINDTYFLLTAVYTISALIPILLGPNCFVTFQQIAVPGIPILARNLVFAIYGQEFPVWAVN